MNTLNIVGPLIAISSVGALVLAIVAVFQDLRQDRKYGYRQAFNTIISLVMLVLGTGAVVSLLMIGAREVLPNAKTYNQRYNSPPSFYLSGDAAKVQTGEAAYSCATDCQFTATDRQSFSDWKTSYQNWKDSSNLSAQTRRDLAAALAIIIIALPLYLMFARWMNHGAKEEYEIHPKTSPLRSVYFYGVAFAGLVTAVVGGAMLLNTMFNVLLKTTPVDKAIYTQSTAELAGADSIIACGKACNFTAADVTLAQQWKSDNQAARDRMNTNKGATANDLATTIPLMLVGLPLFWLHFARIRKEGQPSTPKMTV